LRKFGPGKTWIICWKNNFISATKRPKGTGRLR